ncbi:CBO0543 family protein [Alkalihalobacterium alkalinitrilicum]|uniref:CBO0543 family protein n=1 Tax=Alkalihalobacterium alkalinitrilicum TaxID=427920 RepID=UPI000995CF5F|nr:CBO0543 family protein [Alkalihalobacterium alkalinitrilicum]
MAKHRLEKNIIISSTVITILLLLVYVPRTKVRQALVSLLFHQVITWYFGLLVVEKGLVQYPYRYYFKKSNKSSFIFEYLIFPALAVLFNLYYPEQQTFLKKSLYYFKYTAVVTFFEIIAVKFTDLIRYKNWAWYWSFMTIGVSYYISHAFYRWFMKEPLFRSNVIEKN